MSNNDLSKNGSGYGDLTALKAIKNADKDLKRRSKEYDGDGKPYNRPYNPEEARFYKVLKTLFAIADLAGFRIENRIVLVDKETGRIWD